MIYKGSCHCGKVAFEVEGEITEAMSCNCSMCSRRGSLLWFVPRDKLHLLTPEQDASIYMFNNKLSNIGFVQTAASTLMEKPGMQKVI